MTRHKRRPASSGPTQTRYLIALGSNRPRSRRLGPRGLINAALRAIDTPPIRLLATSRLIETTPLGPGGRRYINAAAIIETALYPRDLLDRLQAIESLYGRRRALRWGARTLDIDIILWSSGTWSDPRLTVPHVEFHTRLFVLQPASAIARNWRDPCTGRTIAHLTVHQRRPRPKVS